MKKINLSIKKNETLLEFFTRCCDEYGFNVSKIITYLEYLDNYVRNIQARNNNELSEELVEEIFDFGNYFFENYGMETKEKRIMTFGVQDSYVLSLYFEISKECCSDEYEEKLNSLTSIEKRKIKRVTEQLLSLSGDLSYILLELDEETEEDLDPIVVPYSKHMSKEMRDSVEEIIKFELMDFFTFKGVLICVVNREDEELEKNDCKNLVFGIAFCEKEISLITAQKMVSIFSSINEDFISMLALDGDEEIEFVDAANYINPLGMSKNQYNQLGEKLPNRKGQKLYDNVVPFNSIIRNNKK